MKKMMRFVAIILAAVIIISAIGCGAESGLKPPTEIYEFDENNIMGLKRVEINTNQFTYVFSSAVFTPTKEEIMKAFSDGLIRGKDSHNIPYADPTKCIVNIDKKANETKVTLIYEKYEKIGGVHIYIDDMVYEVGNHTDPWVRILTTTSKNVTDEGYTHISYSKITQNYKTEFKMWEEPWTGSDYWTDEPVICE